MRSLRWGAVTAAALGALSLAAIAVGETGWTVVSTPTTNTNAAIFGAYARTDTDVWAVGNAFGTAGSPPPPPIAYHSNGSAWSLVPTPNLGVNAGLFAVSASSATDAWAVGFTNTSGYRGAKSLFEHWNGSAWSVVAGANAGSLVGVAALSSTSAWAVSSKGVVVHWNGTAWTTVSTPQPNPSNPFGNQVRSMSASGPSDIWAVGTFTTPSYTTAAYALHFDGATWSVVPMAQPTTGTPAITAVNALSPTNAWAIGQTGTTTLGEHWNGKSWSLMPAVSLSYPSMTAVTARSVNDVWAFGQSGGTPVLLHWNGTSWSSAASPAWSTLYAAATTPGGSHVWAFGFGSTSRPLILSHS
jgi:hypothetical protein